MSMLGQGALFAHEQYRMRRLQVFNWGTFDGLHDVPIAPEGFLFVGRSGSGKTTLLDALSALLMQPGAIRFNAAAREDDRKVQDRNWVSYVRGAWAEQKDEGSGEIATQFLRRKTTWSAIALTYENTAGQTVTLAQIFWIKGAGNSTGDVRRHYLILERPFELRELADFGLDLRKLKAQLPDAYFSDSFNAYSERFRRLLGIGNELALRLLHKTQSAKNLGDLNTFLRDFMLDRPVTFDVAERLVNEFGELSAAHEAVVTAREQVNTLAPAREAWQQREELIAAIRRLESLRAGVDPYRDRLRATLLEATIRERGAGADGAAAELRQGETVLENLRAGLRDLEAEHRESGGDRIAAWEVEQKRLEHERDERLRRRARAENACGELGWPMPSDPAAFAALNARAREILEGGDRAREESQARQVALALEKQGVETEFNEVVAEVRTLERQPSNIPGRMIEMRRTICAALNIDERELPFIGELIEVRPEDAPWRGAIERVFHGFALSLLVEERHYPALSRHINENHLGGRLVYYRTGGPAHSVSRETPPDSLVHKLTLKDGPNREWLRWELDRRFDYRCVENLQQFRKADRALTMEGQVRHGKDHHEKDDRHEINDRRRWVLGFDNQEKLALFKQRAGELADALSALDREINGLKERDRRANLEARASNTLANFTWEEIDAAPLLDRIQTLTRQLAEAREGNAQLRALGERITAQEVEIRKAEQAIAAIRAREARLRDECEAFRRELVSLRASMGGTTLSEEQRAGLEDRFGTDREQPGLKNLDQIAARVERALNEDLKQLAHDRNVREKTVENRFAEFKRRWPLEAGDMDASLAAAGDFLSLLARIESDGLPAYEERFFELLKTQSGQNLAELSTQLKLARKDILERLNLVNMSLRDAPFSPGTYLQIDASDRQLPEVRDFRQQLKEALHNALIEDRDLAEQRFKALRALVEKLASQDPESRRWRDAVLDVRLHVEFIGRELDEEGREVEVYRSGAGKSGGQRQKLATTCLAAALRYQLGGNEDGHPVYAPVVLDEAFDKADNEFTSLAMNIFQNFGFQMIVATPLKSVMTLEPFIGGACYVDIRDRQYSAVLLIEYDTASQRLKLPEIA